MSKCLPFANHVLYFVQANCILSSYDIAVHNLWRKIEADPEASICCDRNCILYNPPMIRDCCQPFLVYENEDSCIQFSRMRLDSILFFSECKGQDSSNHLQVMVRPQMNQGHRCHPFPHGLTRGKMAISQSY